MLGGVGANGEPLPITRERMVEAETAWPVSVHTPESISDQLRVSRELFVHALLVYEFATVGAAWSLLAVESSLRWALGAGQSATFQQLVKRGNERGLLSKDLVEALNAGRQLRNIFGHPTNQPVWTFGIAAAALRTSHVAVYDVSQAVAR